MATLPLILEKRDAERAAERGIRGLLRRRGSLRTAVAWAAWLAALTLFTLLLHGYHPFAEDGGLYAAGIERLLDPALFPHSTPFVTEHLRFSLFASIVAKLARATGLPLPWALFLLYLGSLGFTFAAARQLLRRVVESIPAQSGSKRSGWHRRGWNRSGWNRSGWHRSDWHQLAGLSLLSVWATLPVAGTSLVLLDPYLTARSFCTPLTLLAIAYALDDWCDRGDNRRPVFLCVLCLAATALLHPLMAAYAAAFVVTLRLLRRARRAWVWSGMTVLALGTAAAVQAAAPPEPAAVVAAELSRYYWFLSQWRWYELCGLAGPVLVLLAIWHAGLGQQDSPQPSSPEHSPARNLATVCEACTGLGVIATLVTGLFAHEAAPVHLVARLQPLRIFQPIYAVMALLLGAWLWTFLRRAWTRTISPLGRGAVLLLPAAGLLATAIVMGMAQRSLFPASDHLELPWLGTSYRNPANRDPAVRNPWLRAFQWARASTPRDALFALDADYITAAGEDAQGFRAAAQRSALPDFSKDGGEASITPALAAAWQQGVRAQTGLSSHTDAERAAHLLPLGVTWMVLRSTATTAYPCPYDNGTVKVCRLDGDGLLRVSNSTNPANLPAKPAERPVGSGD